MKQRTGQIYQDKKTGNWIARVDYKNKNGKRTAVKRKADNKTHAREVLKELLETLEKGGRKAIEAEKLTINDLCDYYEKNYLKPAKVINGRKVSGLRSEITVKGYIKLFREYLGGIKLKQLTYEDLRAFRDNMLERPTQQSERISLTTVNRYMAYLRRILNIAERNAWINRNPFKLGDVLIHSADEVKRERVLSIDESQRLIDACTDTRAHIRPIVIAALDLGCRFHELTSLTWQQVDFTEGTISILAENTKTFKARTVAITSRLLAELAELYRLRKSDDEEIFRIKDCRFAFKKACKMAGLTDLRFHDLRRCHASFLDSLGFSIPAIGKQLGHSGDYKVTLRYISRDKQNIRKVADALNSLQFSKIEESHNSDLNELIN
ncbi:MAG TPA: tyrosine-type recombinase/integrase [Pyrinomonadaceae bacterium]